MADDDSTARPAAARGAGAAAADDVEKLIVGLAIARFHPQPAATAIPATLGDAQTMLRGLVGDAFKRS